MAPGTNLGAATPVAIGIGQLSPQDGANDNGDENGQPRQRPQSAMEAKATNDAIAYIRGLAVLRGRNADWAERAVREAASLSATEARQQNVVDFVATDLSDMLAQANGKDVSAAGRQITLATRGLMPVILAPDWRTRLLSVITNPNVALILMMIGIYGLIFEFMNPGALLPGIAGAICLLIGLYALAVLPVTFAGVALILLGIGLMTAEAFTPSFGALGIGGVIAFVFGGMVLIDPAALGFAVHWPVVAGLAIVSFGFSAVAVRMAVASRRRPIVAGMDQIIGLTGRVEDWSQGRGHVFLRGESWNAVSPLPLAPGAIVQVTGVEGLVLSVVPASGNEP
jgi:membrane-bound serine protease (ClpP class)